MGGGSQQEGASETSYAGSSSQVEPETMISETLKVEHRAAVTRSRRQCVAGVEECVCGGGVMLGYKQRLGQ